MLDFTLMLGLTVSIAVLFGWAFRALPKARWQFLAVIPVAQSAPDIWAGRNVTYYGFFIATAYAFATLTLLVLAGALTMPVETTLLICGLIVAMGITASRVIAAVVEKKKHTFTVGGASFAVLVITPLLLTAFNHLPWRAPEAAIPVMPFMAAVATAYCFGEGLGRLACISFGCCYGRPLAQSHPLIRKLFARRAFVFTGRTKKIAYAAQLDGAAVVPIQAVTATVNAGVGLASLGLFLSGRFNAAFLLAIIVSQSWRVVSEWMRGDFRGNLAAWPLSCSAYQIMAALSIGFALFLTAFLPIPADVYPVDTALGLKSVWNAGILLFIEGVWLLVFFYQGISRVTNATLAFHVDRDRI